MSTFVISPRQSELYAYLRRDFSLDPRVRVVLDRRVGDRRTMPPRRYRGDRRRGERQTHHPIHNYTAFLGYAMVRLDNG
jgi:hypothetical protein